MRDEVKSGKEMSSRNSLIPLSNLIVLNTSFTILCLSILLPKPQSKVDQITKEEDKKHENILHDDRIIIGELVGRADINNIEELIR